MLKSDGDEVIAAPMDSSRDLINSEATRLPESTAAMLCFVWVEVLSRTIVLAVRAVQEST